MEFGINMLNIETDLFGVNVLYANETIFVSGPRKNFWEVYCGPGVRSPRQRQHPLTGPFWFTST